MNRLFATLGLCARAGKLISGEKAVITAIRAHNVCCVLLDAAAAENAVKSVTDACTFHNVPLIRTQANALGDAIGKPSRMAAAVTDAGFAKSILALAARDSL